MAASTSRISKVDEYGFKRPSDFDYSTYEEFMSMYLRVLARRAKKWSELLGSTKKVNRNYRVKRYVRKGISGDLRGLVWMMTSGADELQQQDRDHYRTLLQGPFKETVVESIKTDIPRTFPNNIYFTDTEDGLQKPLFNILIAFAHENPAVEYCQGLNYISGLLLVVTKDEEMAFWLLKVMVEKILPDYYTSDMTGVIIDIEVLSQLVRLKVPVVYSHVEKLGVPWAVIATKWFVCAFAEVLPVETVLRVWDCLFYEGPKILFRVALTLMKKNEQKLLACPDFPSLVECFKSITQDAHVHSCHEFMKSVFREPGSFPMATVTKLRKQSAEKVRQEQMPR